jgi:hypothetical protein
MAHRIVWVFSVVDISDIALVTTPEYQKPPGALLGVWHWSCTQQIIKTQSANCFHSWLR